ncbi:hypothetical protein CDN99_21625 [Roseateles aquatilis]|uniref:Glycosyltransferase subfamily 4-like N-terminal domain-containing protein n=1 Tax=Roseateles aquatilis TaxID=431061 RepID=A0A246IZA7_9BURK|nr:glycosyltransferase family 4 protein [Roseateles aquatilis]OWQ85683.1 hypothetical protein CDN99_21625 [Roseateles aquatilis]
MRALSIVHVVFSSRIAGGEHHCVDLANAQAALGHTVHVIAPAKSAVQGVLNPNVQFHGLALPLMRGLRVRRLAQRLQADVVHGHLGPACKAVSWVADAARLGTLHVGFKAHQHARLDGLVCVNSRQVGDLKDFDGLHRVIHNWAPDRREGTGERTQRVGTLRQELGIPVLAPVIGCVGRLHETKGMHRLIEAFRQQAPADAHLVLIGEGPQRAELEAQCEGEDRIHLIGFRWNVDELLAEMDLYVSSSLEEAFPLAILEAMRAGLPIVATATIGAREMLQDEQATIVPLDDIQALGQGIADALRARARTGRAPIAYAMERFDRGAAVQSTLGLYREVLARLPVVASDLAFSPEEVRG